MSSRTKIVVLHMKEIIYTAIFAALALLVIVLLIFMFGTGKKDSAVKKRKTVHARNIYFHSHTK